MAPNGAIRGHDGTDGSTRNGRPVVVVNVNDNEAARYMTSVMLRRAGFEVREAADGKSALALADELPDVIVLDVRLPDIDGFEVCRRVRANPKTAHIKILHTSATFVTLEKKIEGLEIGADGYLAQPFEMQELVATVQSLVRLSSAEHALRDRADELVEAGRRKDEFLAMLAHELRNPLSAIRASFEFLCQRPALNEREIRARDIIDRQVDHLGQLVDDLLDVARVTHGKIELHRKLVDLAEILQRVVGSARDTKAGPRRQDLSLHLPDAPLVVHADPLRLEQVFANLLDNASKYTDSGGAINVSVSRLAGETGARVRVVIRDNGIGMSPQTLASVFELFSQGDVAIDRSRGGLGIGLTLVRSLVELHAGRVTVDSRGPGLGSEVEVDLPLVSAEQGAIVERTSSWPPLPAVPPSRRILLVEDNLDLRQGLADLWEDRGHHVTAVSDGVDAIRCALADKPDIAFVDIGLPELDGYEVARRLRREPDGRELLLVALTGYGSPEQKQRALEAGFDHHLTKPVEPELAERLVADLAYARSTSRRIRGA